MKRYEITTIKVIQPTLDLEKINTKIEITRKKSSRFIFFKTGLKTLLRVIVALIQIGM